MDHHTGQQQLRDVCVAQDCTAAQMESTLKNRLSHRGQAIATFMPQLQAMLDK